MRELRLLELQRQQEELAKISAVAPCGPTSKDILKAIQTAVKKSDGGNHPLSLRLFADALRHDERVSHLLKADTEAQKRGATEAVEALQRALASSEGALSQSVVIDLFFSPEAETEKLLTSMQRDRNQCWKLDNRSQNKAMATLESSLATKLASYNERETAISQELAEVRAALAERDAEEKQEMELLAASANAQRERNAVKLQQKAQLERSKVLRKSKQDALFLAASIVTDTHVLRSATQSVLVVK